MSLPKFSVSNPVLVNMAMILFIIFGIKAMIDMPKESMPAINLGVFVINVSYPGVSADEMESLIVKKIEDEIEDVMSIDYISSEVFEGRASIAVNLKQNADIDEAWSDVQQELDKVRDLPEDATTPLMRNISTKELKSVCTIALSGDYDSNSLRDIAENISDDIRSIPYVSKVEMMGQKVREIQIKLDKIKASEYNITFGDIQNAISSQNVSLPAGKIQSGTSEMLVRTEGEIDAVDKIKYIIVKRYRDNQVIRIRDIAEVIDGFSKDKVITRLNGHETISLNVYQTMEGNIVKIVEQINSYLQKTPQHYKYLHAKIVNDGSTVTRNNIRTLSSSALVGMIMVFFVLWLMIGWRNAILAAFGIPFSFLVSFFLMNYFGITINNLTLFALILVLGMIVDDAIVVIENVHRKIEDGLEIKKAAIDGTKEIMWPVVAAVTTTISAFLPLLMMKGMMGKFLSFFPKVVTIALVVSLFEALFILPSHLADFSRKTKRKTTNKESLFIKIIKLYKKILVYFLGHRIRVILLVVFALIISVLAIIKGYVKFEFFPPSTPSTIIVQVETPTGSELLETDKISRKIEKFITNFQYKEDIEDINVNVGQMQIDKIWEESTNYIELRVDLVDADDLKFEPNEIKRAIRMYLMSIPEVSSYKFVVERHGPPTGGDIDLRITGKNLSKMLTAAENIETILRDIPGVTDIDNNYDEGKEEIKIIPIYDKLSLNGLTSFDIARAIRTATFGQTISKYREDTEEYDIVLSYKDKNIDDIEELENLKIKSRSGQTLFLKDVCKLVVKKGIVSLRRRNGKRLISVTASVGNYEKDGKTFKRTPDEAQEILFGNKMKGITGKLKPLIANADGFSIEKGGQAEERKKSFSSLFLAFGIAVLLIYTILGTQFKSYVQPLVVMLTIPFSFIGVIFGLGITSTPFSLLTFISVVSLTGIVVNDSLILVDFVNKQRDEGIDRWNSLINAGAIRLRPIYLTTITTIIGLMPMIISKSDAVSTWKPMAVSIAFGLGFATVLTLLVIPVVYSLIDSFFGKIGITRFKKHISLSDALALRDEAGYDNWKD